MFIPKPIRKWIQLFRGDVVPALIVISAMLGFWFGLMPGWYGLHVGLLVLVLVLNVHLGVFLLFAAIAKSLSVAAAPLLYHLGVWVHDSAPGIVAPFAATPILGISDFSRYALLGALLLGPTIGLVLGIAAAIGVQSFRRTWLRIEEGSETFQKWQQKRWVRFFDWLLFGKNKIAREALTTRARYVRLPGVIVAVVLLAASGTAAYFVQRSILTDYAGQSLTSVNGAEVNLAALDLQPFLGRISATDIRATDSERPASNRVSVGKMAADVSLWSLFFGRIVMDEVELSGVGFDTPRSSPGRVVRRPEPGEPAAADAPGAAAAGAAGEEFASLESYVKQAQQIRDWLAAARKWIPRGGEPEAAEETPPTQYLEYLTARADSPAAPRFVVRRLVLDPVEMPVEAFGASTLTCTNLSDAPRASSDPVTIEIASRDGKAACRFVQHFGAAPYVDVSAKFEDLDLAAFQQQQLNASNPVVLNGGKATATVSGKLTHSTVELAISVTTHDLQASTSGGLFGLDPEIAAEAMKLLREVTTTLRIVGSLREPRVVFDTDALRAEMREALVKAGKNELLRRMDQLAGDKLPGGVPKTGEVLEDPLGAATKGLPGLLGGKKKEDKP